MTHEYLTRPEAAQYLRISVPQIDNLARAGELVRAKFGEGPRARVLYRRRDLDCYVERHLEAIDTESDDPAA